MKKIQTQHPYIDEQGNIHSNLIKTWALDEETGEKYYIIQLETGTKYGEAIDVFPLKYTYSVSEEKIEEEKQEENT